MKICITCKESFKEKREGQIACSRSCNAIYHNKQLAKRFVCPRCPICGEKTRPEGRAKYCSLICQGKGRRGDKHPLWKGGRKIHSEGYVYVYMPDHPKSESNGYILEHRLVMEKSIGRFLTKAEVIHHVNGKKSDNRLENLMLLKNQSEHLVIENYLRARKSIRSPHKEIGRIAGKAGKGQSAA